MPHDIPPVLAILALAYSAYLLTAAAGLGIIGWLIVRDTRRGNHQAPTPESQAGYPEHTPPD